MDLIILLLILNGVFTAVGILLRDNWSDNSGSFAFIFMGLILNAATFVFLIKEIRS